MASFFVAHKPMRHPSAEKIALLICAGYIVMALLYAAATPPFEAPDEGAHFLYSHNLLETRQLPVLEGRRDTFASKSVQRHHPPLYYLIGAGLIAWIDRSDVDDYLVDNPFGSVGFVSVNNQNIYLHNSPGDGNTIRAVWVLRLYSLALATGTLHLIFRVGQIVLPGQPVGLPAMLLTASIPGFVAGGGSINNDNLVTFLFAAGIYVSLRMWRQQNITRTDLIALCLILPAAALSKLTGLTLFPLVYAALVLGVLRGRYSLRDAARVVIVTGLAALALAGWWYLRNQLIYGDPFALAATRGIWSRGTELSITPAQIYLEAKGIWESFWMVLGHLSIRGADWLYGYVTVISILGAAGLILLVWRQWAMQRESTDMQKHVPTEAAHSAPNPPIVYLGHQFDGLLLLLATCGLITVSLIMATRQINISQGRLLYPALIGFTPLLALGWQGLFGRRVAPLLILPLAVVMLLTPFTHLSRAFTPAHSINSLPEHVQVINARAESLTLAGYELHTPVVNPGGIIELDVYFSGAQAENPAFFVTALDPDTNDTFGGVDIYPGMAATNWLDPDVIYVAPVRFRIDAVTNQRPLQLSLAVGWRVPETDESPPHYLDWRDSNDTPLEILTLPGSILIDPTYQPPPPEQATDVLFGDSIRLEGYSVVEAIQPGADLTVTFNWRTDQPMSEDYTLTLGLIDENGDLIVQADAMPPGYPTSAWQPGVAFADERTLSIPADIEPGNYRVYVGWYSTPEIVRLPAQGDSVENDLFILPTTIQVDVES